MADGEANAFKLKDETKAKMIANMITMETLFSKLSEESIAKLREVIAKIDQLDAPAMKYAMKKTSASGLTTMSDSERTRCTMH